MNSHHLMPTLKEMKKINSHLSPASFRELTRSWSKVRRIYAHCAHDFRGTLPVRDLLYACPMCNQHLPDQCVNCFTCPPCSRLGG